MFMKDKKSASLFQKEQVMESLKQSFVKLNPRVMIKNPIMFTVEDLYSYYVLGDALLYR